MKKQPRVFLKPEYGFDRVPEIFPENLGKFRRESEGVNRRMGRVWTKRTEQERK